VSGAAKGPDALLNELGALLSRLDPLPPDVVDQARQLYSWRSIDAELADLSFDSLLDRETALAVRSMGESVFEPRMLGFSALVDGEDLAIEVEVTSADGECTMLGQLSPPGATTIRVQAGGGETLEALVDELGRFLVRPLPHGPVRLQVTHAGRVVQTTWISYAT
jgi:hypothetical protein